MLSHDSDLETGCRCRATALFLLDVLKRPNLHYGSQLSVHYSFQHHFVLSNCGSVRTNTVTEDIIWCCLDPVGSELRKDRSVSRHSQEPFTDARASVLIGCMPIKRICIQQLYRESPKTATANSQEPFKDARASLHLDGMPTKECAFSSLYGESLKTANCHSYLPFTK